MADRDVCIAFTLNDKYGTDVDIHTERTYYTPVHAEGVDTFFEHFTISQFDRMQNA